jgi:hypothetical protein
MKTKREKAAAIVQALLQKTAANGATEAEAMAAAEKARELMDRYQIESGSAGLEKEGAFKASIKRGHYKTLAVKDRLAYAVAQFCDCKVWLTKSSDECHFFGLKTDAEFAGWLIVSLERFVASGALAYIAGQPRMDARPRWEAEKAFVFGACVRISERLMQLATERQKSRDGTGDGRSLVVIKNVIVTREFAKLNMKLRSGGRSKTRAVDGGAFNAGRAAGDKASFGRPVNGGGKVAQIGGKA